MKTSERINSLWESLEKEMPTEKGYVSTLFSTTLPLQFFLAMKFPEKNRAIVIDVPEKTTTTPSPFHGKIELQFFSSVKKTGVNKMFLTLSDQSLRELFNKLIEDCIDSMPVQKNENDAFLSFCKRLAEWQKMMEVYSENGLSTLVQQGLFAELTVLSRLIQLMPSRMSDFISSWQGPEKLYQDFKFQRWAIEVKSSVNSDLVYISNETQLTRHGHEKLFLWHLVLDRLSGSGVSLVNILGYIRQLIGEADFIRRIFEQKLASAGYFDHQDELYKTHGYFIRQETIYEIQEGFPAINTSNIPPNINEVKYVLNLSGCTSFIRPQSTVIEAIKSL